MNSINDRDRISELPESVLHLILSSLNLKLAIQTSILSTKWRYVWKSLPFLKFSCNEFHSSKWYALESANNSEFHDFVDNVLNLRDGSSSIQRFHFSCYNKGIDESDFGKRLSRWITTAVESNVEDMYMQVNTQIFQLPQCLLNCKSLRKLKLISTQPFGYELLKLPDSMNLPELKSLVLLGAQFEGNDDDDITSKIISSCPVLESLEFKYCSFHRPTVDIYAPQLKHLVLRHCDEFNYQDKIDLNKYIVKLNAPNLVSLCCEDDMIKDYCLVNVSSVVKAEIYMEFHLYDEDGNLSFDDEIREVFVQRMLKILKALHNVENLSLSSWFIEVVTRGLALLRSSSLQFCNLRCLKLFIWHSRDCFSAMAHLLKISPNIESLDVEIKKGSNLEKIEGDWELGTLHHLELVRICGVRGLHNELQFLEILLKNGMVLKKVIIIEPPWSGELSREFVQQLLTLPRASSNIEFLVP